LSGCTDHWYISFQTDYLQKEGNKIQMNWEQALFQPENGLEIGEINKD
jgi:hypothetical protein